MLYGPGGAVWASCTNGAGVGNVQMQLDGNLVMYTGGGAVWNTFTYGNSGAYLSVQNDGRAVVFSQAGSQLWASTSWCH